MNATRKGHAPGWVLLFLAPALGELLSGSAPPAEFFNPFGFLLLCILYGGGALIVRELLRRWGKGWPSLLALGAAYGIVEEGLMVKSFFDPNWMDLGILGSYGRALGVNWVWSVELTLYHMVVSIAAPIALVGLIFPDRRNDSWISPRAYKLLWVLFVLDVLFGFTLLTRYRPPLIPYLGSALAVAALVLVARRLPAVPALTLKRWSQPWRPVWFYLVGLLATVGFFVSAWIFPHAQLPAWVPALFMPLVVGLAGGVVLWLAGNAHGPAPRQRVGLIAGILSPFILLTPFREFAPNPPDNPRGMLGVGIAAVVFLIWVARRVRRFEVPPRLDALPPASVGSSLDPPRIT